MSTDLIRNISKPPAHPGPPPAEAEDRPAPKATGVPAESDDGPQPQPEPRTNKRGTPTQMDTRSGATKWSKAVQRVSKGCLTDELTDDELEELLGAATYLANYCRGVLTTRKGKGK